MACRGGGEVFAGCNGGGGMELRGICESDSG